MRFRPCIDIHNGKVKQIVGGSLRDVQDQAEENFVSGQDAAFYAELYKEKGLKGGHVILLNSGDSPYFPATKEQALLALKAYPGGLQIGGGVNPDNAREYLQAGASHVIVTSYVFKDGKISWENLEKIEKAAGREHLVIDLSCRKKEDAYYQFLQISCWNPTEVLPGNILPVLLLYVLSLFQTQNHTHADHNDSSR